MGLKVIRGGAPEDVEDDAPVLEKGEESPSHTRRKQTHAQRMGLLLADLEGRTKGLQGAKLETEIDAFVERVIEAQLKAVPHEHRAELQAKMRSLVESDPMVSALVRELRAAK
jgi:hypothetical protein